MTSPAETPDTVDSFAERMFAAALGALEIQAVYLGDGWVGTTRSPYTGR